MPLYDVTGKDTLVLPSASENYEVLTTAAGKIDKRRMKKDENIIDEAIQAAVDKATKKSKLIFTKAGILVGHSSITPTAHTKHIWETAEMAYPTSTLMKRNDLALAGELQLKWVGGMVRWRISLRPEMWLVYRRDSGTFNQFTGKEIKVSEYWVSDTYVPAMPPKKRGHSINDLKGKEW